MAGLYWFKVTLEQFDIFDTLIQWIEKALEYDFVRGDWAVTLSNVFTFIIMILVFTYAAGQFVFI